MKQSSSSPAALWRTLYRGVRAGGGAWRGDGATPRAREGRDAARQAGRLLKFPRGLGALRAPMERAAKAAVAPAAQTTLAMRLRAHLLGIYAEEISRRGGETGIQTGPRTWSGLSVTAYNGVYALLRADAWRYYSSRTPMRRASVVYLCGTDDAGRWAVRVPSTVTSIAAALEHVEPAVVATARRAGKQVLRQGDVYLVEARTDDFSALPPNHRWDNNSRMVVHDGGHATLHVPFRARAIVQTVMRMGRNGTRRTTGD